MEAEIRIRGTIDELRQVLGVIPQNTQFTWKEEPIPAPEEPVRSRRKAEMTGICIRCGKEYQKTSNVQKRCNECRIIHTKEMQAKSFLNKKAATAAGSEDPLKSKLDHIKRTCPAPTPRPEYKGDLL